MSPLRKPQNEETPLSDVLNGTVRLRRELGRTLAELPAETTP